MTTAELLGVSKYLPYAIWILYFIKAQGYTLKTKKLLQDNQSTIRILNNGKKSAGKQSRHIDIRFFWTSDRLKMYNIKVEYCPIEHMLGDFFTQLLQGSPFKDMRDVVMWHKNGGILDNYFNNARSTTLDRKERVAENKNHNKENDKNNRFWRITQN